MKNKKRKKNKKDNSPRVNSAEQEKIFQSVINYKYLPVVFALIYLVILSYLSFTYHKIGDYGVETDFYWNYVHSAQAFLNGNILIDEFRGPLYQIVLGIFEFVIGEYLKAGMIINLFSASAVIFLSMSIIRKIFSNEYSFFTGVLLVINPIFIQYTYSAGTDMFFNALICLAVYLLLFKNEYSISNIILPAFVTGLAYLTRYNGIFLIILFFVILLINYWEIDFKSRIKSALIFSATFFITITPWGIFLLIKKGSFFYNENYKNIAYELYGKGKISWDSFWYSGSNQFSSLTEVIFKDPINFVIHMLQNVYQHFLLDMERLIGWQLGVLVILGIIVFLINNPLKYLKSRKFVYLAGGGVFFLILLLVFYSERFSLFLIPFYVVMALYPLLSNGKSLKKFLPKSVLFLIIIFITLFTFTKSYSFNASRIDSGPKEILQLRDWYFANVPVAERGKTIAARKPQIAYYLKMNFNVIPLADNYQDFLNKIKKEKDDYLYFGIMEAQTRPALRGLLNPKNNFPGLRPIVYFSNPPAVLYKVE